MQSLKGDKKQLEGDSFFSCRKPVEFKQNRGNVVKFRGHGEPILLPHSELVVTCPTHRMVKLVNHLRLSCKSPVLR